MASPLAARIAPRPSPVAKLAQTPGAPLARAPLRAIAAIPASVPLAKVLKTTADDTSPASQTLVESDEAPATVRTPPPEECEPPPGSVTLVSAFECEPELCAAPERAIPREVATAPTAPAELGVDAERVFASGVRPRLATVPAFFPYDPAAEPVELPMAGPIVLVRAFALRLATFARGLVAWLATRHKVLGAEP